MTVSVARSFDHSDIVGARVRASRWASPARWWRSGKRSSRSTPARDERFEGMASVEDLRLRSVMCLPDRASRSVPKACCTSTTACSSAPSRQEDLELVELFAGQASIAIKNARLVAELRERNHRLEASRKQIERLNEQLGRKVRDRDTELAVVRAELGRERGRYDYTAIVGASDAMRTIFQQLDRIIEIRPAGPDPRRERHGQGADRARDPLQRRRARTRRS